MARRERARGSPLYLGNRRYAQREPRPIADAMADETRALETTLSRLDPQALAEIAEALASARRVRALGFRNSRFIAEYAAASLSQLRPGVASLDPDGQCLGERLIELAPGDVLIAVGLRRRRRGFKDVVRIACDRGARVLLLADKSIRETPAEATWTLDCVVETLEFADSYSGAMALVRLLVLETARKLGKAGRDYLGEVEALRTDLGELE